MFSTLGGVSILDSSVVLGQREGRNGSWDVSISKTLIPGRGVALKWEGRNGGVSLLEDGKNVAKPKKGSNTGLFFIFFWLASRLALANTSSEREK